MCRCSTIFFSVNDTTTTEYYTLSLHDALPISKDEIENALAVQNAIQEAKAKGSGVISMNGKMVDKPVVEKADRVIETAKASNLIDEEGNYIGE